MKSSHLYFLLGALIPLCIVLIGLVAYFYGQWQKKELSLIKVAILHSMTWTLAISEVPVIGATKSHVLFSFWFWPLQTTAWFIITAIIFY